MQKLFDEVSSLDKRCYDKFALSEDILMEHAADGMAQYIHKNFAKKSKVLVVCGSGNNGADGIALARLLHADYDVKIFYVKELRSEMAILQDKRVHSIGLKTTIYLNECDILVDALYGTGFNSSFNYEEKSVMDTINNLKAFKIACDIPSGIKRNGECDENTFVADITLTMGALKKSMFSDAAKEFVGRIKILDLGVSRSIYEGESNWNLLDFKDLELPLRDKKNTHKGSFGHLAIPCGDKQGASTISAMAALRFGSGLVSLISFDEPSNLPASIMHAQTRPKNTTAIACGMGLGEKLSEDELTEFLDNSLPLIVDADMFCKPIILDILKRENVVLTPHPKEFIALLKAVNIANISIEELQNNRFKYSEEFCKKYPKITLLLKGANVIIGKNDTFYINSYGTSALAKAGSGDVLSGLIGALLAQGYSSLESAINGSLTHTKLVKNYKGADFSLTPEDLINEICNL